MVDGKRNKGFTLAELLIVVAIIGVLVAISIPIYSGLVQKARLAANQANAREAYAAVETEFLTTDHRSEGETYYTSDLLLGSYFPCSSRPRMVSSTWACGLPSPSSWTAKSQRIPLLTNCSRQYWLTRAMLSS